MLRPCQSDSRSCSCHGLRGRKVTRAIRRLTEVELSVADLTAGKVLALAQAMPEYTLLLGAKCLHLFSGIDLNPWTGHRCTFEWRATFIPIDVSIKSVVPVKSRFDCSTCQTLRADEWTFCRPAGASRAGGDDAIQSDADISDPSGHQFQFVNVHSRLILKVRCMASPRLGPSATIAPLPNNTGRACMRS